ncbi:hypothetical protein EIK77_001182 [Talaromyces pinophilus]|nr:hypothetical protein EIK77_001182 [Talaromyces pinophilus]
MNQPTHIIDPDGEVVILLRNEKFNFAQWKEDVVTEIFKDGSAPEDVPVAEDELVSEDAPVAEDELVPEDAAVAEDELVPEDAPVAEDELKLLVEMSTNKIAVSLNNGRQKAIDKLFDFVQETQEAFLNGSIGCDFECSSIMYGALASNILSKDLRLRPVTPFLELEYRSLIRKLLSFDSPVWSMARSRQLHSCSDSSFKLLFSNLPETIEGLEI